MNNGDRPKKKLPRRRDIADFNWNDISVFLVLARHRSLSSAAKELSVNHSTIGRRIRALENSLETRLFERTRQGFLLTEDGDRLLREAEGFETHASNISAQFGGQTAPVTGTVRVASMEALGSLFLAPKLSLLYERHPSVLIELVTSSHWINLSKREADVLISFSKPLGQRITTEKIGEFSLFLYASDDYLDKYGIPQVVGDLEKHLFIDYIEELVAISAVRWLSDVIRISNTSFRSTSLVAQYHAATAGIGIAMLPTFVAQNDSRLRQVLPKQVVVKRDFWLSVHNDFEHIARVRQVVQFLKDLISENTACLTGEKPWL